MKHKETRSSQVVTYLLTPEKWQNKEQAFINTIKYWNNFPTCLYNNF